MHTIKSSNKDHSLSIPDNFILLKISSDGSESLFISGLLESYGIEVYIESEGVTPVTGVMDGPIPKYSIFVNKKSFDEAKRLLEAPNLYHEDQEFREYKQMGRKKGAFWGRVIALISAAFFYALSSLPIKESDKSMRYVLIGASLFFVLLFIFSFYGGKEEKGSILYSLLKNSPKKHSH